MGHCYPHLSLEERSKIAKWRDARMPIPEIAERLHRAASTIYRELKRNVFSDSELPQLSGYFAVTAQEAYERRRANHCKLARHQSLKLSVLDRLRAGWSPEQIAGRMRLEAHPLRVSHKTIYRLAYSKAGRAVAFFQLLPEQRRRRRPRGHRRQNRMQAVDFPSLRLRPEQVSQRLSFGHWECDLVMFQKEHGKVNVTSLVERVSRYAVIFRNEDRRSTPIMETLINGLAPLPADARQSITFDRGTEFSAWRRLKDGIGAESWFCDPQSPWQKGTVENTNNRLRRYLPRSTDPTALTNRYLKSICQRLNTTPLTDIPQVACRLTSSSPDFARWASVFRPERCLSSRKRPKSGGSSLEPAAFWPGRAAFPRGRRTCPAAFVQLGHGSWSCA